MKHCCKCRVEKLEADFYFDKRRNALLSPCKECRIITVKKLNHSWRKNNPEKTKASNFKSKLKSKYGISPDQFLNLWKNQNGLCAICAKTILLDSSEKALQSHVDHCHVSGVVRGLLCLTCNTGIGMLNDSIDLLDAAKQYLQRRGASTVKGESASASVSAANSRFNTLH